MAGFRRVVRKAFTLVELLVAIAIIAVLMGLLIPGVQMARESGRKVHCRSNLRSMALAVQSYETAHRIFPAGYVANHAASDVDATTLDASPGTGWGLAIAAFLEEQRAAAAVRPNDPAPRQARTTRTERTGRSVCFIVSIWGSPSWRHRTCCRRCHRSRPAAAG